MDQFDLLAQAVKGHFLKLVDKLWGCSHKRTSFPIMIAGGHSAETYVVCMRCGRRLPYDWTNMCKSGGP